MRKIIISAFALCFHLVSFSQNFTIEETVTGPRKYAPENALFSQWKKNENAIVYLSKDYQSLLERNNSDNWKEKTLASTSELSKSLQETFPNEQFELRFFPYNFNWKTEEIISFDIDGKDKKYFIQYDLKNQKIKKSVATPTTANEPIVSKNFDVAWLEDNNIKITRQNGTTISITNDSNKGIVNGNSYVHRQEFGINKGMWWNETGNQLAYYRKDETMVGDYPIINWNEREAVNNNIKYPMAGMKSEEVTLQIFNLETQKTVQIQTGEPKEQYLTIVSWHPNGENIFIGVLNREQNHLKFNQYSTKTGAFIKTLFEEKASTWVEPQHNIIFVPNNSEQFIYQTDNNGYNQMYLYSTSGKLIKDLGFQNVIVQDFLGFSSDNKSVYYTGITNQGLDRQLFNVSLKSGKTTQLTSASGTHIASVSFDGKYILDTFSNTETPNKVEIINTKTKEETILINAANPFTGKIDLPKMEIISLIAADGKTPLNGRILYPTNFDPTQKYPVMIYVYGGSHAQLVTNKWLGGAGFFDYYMAQQGYVVFTLDNRGSDARGKHFCDVNHRQLGINEMADQLKGVEFLKSKNFVDSNKIGVFGWSFGGFMTTSLLTTYPDMFKVGVAGGPVIDWKYYEVMYGERYMDTPQENPEGYEKASLLNKAANLKARLLMIHGAQDPVVVQQNSMNFIEACIKAGKPIDYFLYPNHEHNVRGTDRIHMYAKIADYFNTFLK